MHSSIKSFEFKKDEEKSLNINLSQFFNMPHAIRSSFFKTDDSRKHFQENSIIWPHHNSFNCEKSSPKKEQSFVAIDSKNSNNFCGGNLTKLTMYDVKTNQTNTKLKSNKKRIKQTKTKEKNKRRKNIRSDDFDSYDEKSESIIAKIKKIEKNKISFLDITQRKSVGESQTHVYSFREFIENGIERTQSKNEYPCHFCLRIFTSPAAQGGHQSKHHRGKSIHAPRVLKDNQMSNI